MTNPENHAAFSREMGYATSNKEELKLLSPDVKGDIVSTPETLKQIVNLDADWLEKYRASTLDRWNKWLSA